MIDINWVNNGGMVIHSESSKLMNYWLLADPFKMQLKLFFLVGSGVGCVSVCILVCPGNSLCSPASDSLKISFICFLFCVCVLLIRAETSGQSWVLILRSHLACSNNKGSLTGTRDLPIQGSSCLCFTVLWLQVCVPMPGFLKPPACMASILQRYVS